MILAFVYLETRKSEKGLCVLLHLASPPSFGELGMHPGLWSCFAHALPLSGTLGNYRAVRDA